MPGAGGVGGLCGFVSGGLMFIGAWGGYYDIPRTKLRHMSQRFSQAITERFGSLHCQELRGDCAVLAVDLLNFCIPILAEEIEKVNIEMRRVKSGGALWLKKLTFKYPRRKVIRTAIHHLTKLFLILSHIMKLLEPKTSLKSGPLLVVANHFNFLDPVALVSSVPWPVEFVGGFRTPNAPAAISWLRETWGYYPVFRGTGSTLAFRATDAVLAQNGMMAIFPEGSSSAGLLRPARPGVAYMASRSQIADSSYGI